MNRKKLVRAGFIGAGHIAERHARWLQAKAGSHILAWSSRSHSTAEQQATRFGGEAMAVPELLQRPDIDLVLVCSPTMLHGTHATAALNAGKWVFCEKPLAAPASAAAALAAVAPDRLYPGHVLRFFHAYRQARELIHRGAIGKVRRVECRRRNSHEGEDALPVLLDLLVHDVDWLQWVFGAPTRSLKPINSTSDREHGRISVEVDWHPELRVVLEGDCGHHCFEQQLHVTGALGELVLHPDTPDVLLLSQNGSQRPFALQGLPDPYALQMQQVVAWVQGGVEPAISAEEAALAVANTERLLTACW